MRPNFEAQLTNLILSSPFQVKIPGEGEAFDWGYPTILRNT
jgi:hypothetical protein